MKILLKINIKLLLSLKIDSHILCKVSYTDIFTELENSKQFRRISNFSKSEMHHLGMQENIHLIIFKKLRKIWCKEDSRLK